MIAVGVEPTDRDGDPLLQALRAGLWGLRTISSSWVYPAPFGDGHRAYVVPAGNASPRDVDDQVSTLAAELGLDIATVQISALPVTDDGTVDGRALEAMEAAGSGLLPPLHAALDGLEVLDREARLQPAPVPLTLPPLAAAAPPPSVGMAGVQDAAPAVVEAPLGIGRPVFGMPFVQQPWHPSTLLEALDRAAERGAAGVTCVSADGSQSFQSYRDLRTAALRLAASLLARVPVPIGPERRVLIATKAASDIIPVYWGCLYAGLLPILLTSPAATREQARERAASIVQALRPCLAVADADDDEFAAAVAAAGETIVCTASALRELSAPITLAPADPAACAMLALTSGSTGLPKGVPLSHSAILAKALAVAQMLEIGTEDSAVNWMPLDHVGGMVWLSLVPICIGCSQVQVATTAVTERPGLILDLFESHCATFSWSSNFGLRLMTDEVSRQPLRRWDLSAMRLLVNAGEPLNLALVGLFGHALRRHGLRDGAVRPAFGMSETCSGITYAGPMTIDDAERGGHASLGTPIPGAAIRIVSEGGQPLPEGFEGYLEVSGPSVFRGYESPGGPVRTAFDGPWFRTGDRAVTRDGQLFVIGRSKSVVTVNGATIACEEIEGVVDELAAVLPFSATVVPAITAAGEAVTVTACPRWTDSAALVAFDRSVRAAVANRFGFQPAEVLPLAPDEIQRTSIGKIVRAAVTGLVLGGGLSARARWMRRLCQDGLPPLVVARRAWRRQLSEAPRPVSRGTVWLLLAPDAATASELASALACSGAEVASAHPAEAYARTGPRSFTCRQSRAEDIGRAFGALRADGRTPRAVVHVLRDTQSGSLAAAVAGLLAEVEATLQAVGAIGASSRCLFVTRGGYAVTGVAASAAHMAVQGALRTAMERYPMLDIRVLDLPAGVGLDSGSIRDAASSGQRDRIVAVRTGVCWVPRLAADAPADSAARSQPKDGLYLVAGGLGGMGYLAARHLAQARGARLLLVGRTPTAALDRRALQQKLAELLDAGAASAEYVQADITDADNLRRVVGDRLAASGTALVAVVHSACTLAEDAALPAGETLAQALLTQALGASVAGTAALHALAREHGGAGLVILSSLSGMLGNPGYAAYAAGSSFQQILAEHAQPADGVPTWCVSFSMVAGTGVSARFPFEAAVRARGMRVLSPDTAIEQLADCLARPPGHYLVGLEPAHPAIRAEFDRSVHPVAQLACYAVPGAGGPLPASLRIDDVRGNRAECRVVPLRMLPRDAAGQLVIAECQDVLGAKAAPQTGLEQTVAQVWARVLGQASPGIDDNFFEHGGSSLLAVQLSASLRESTGLAATPAHIAQAATIRGLAALLEGLAASPATPPSGPFRATPAQVGIWAACQADPSIPLYNTALGISIAGALDADRLGAALQSVARRHASLRTRFEFEGPALMGRPASEREVSVAFEDWRGRTQGEALDRAVHEFVCRTFDLRLDLPMRALLCQLEDRRWLLVCAVHHIVFDDGSTDVLLDELGRLYIGASASSLPPPFSFAAFCDGQAAGAAGMADSMARRLAGSVPTALRPSWPSSKAGRSVDGDAVSLTVPSDQAAKLRAVAATCGTSLFQVVFAALVALLHRQEGDAEVTVGCAVDRRPPNAIGRAVGMFVNVLPVRVAVDARAGLAALVAAVRDEFTALDAAGDASLSVLARAAWPGQVAQRNGGLGILVTENRGHVVHLGADCRAAWFPIATDTTAADLTVLVTAADGRLSVTFEFAADVFDRPRIKGLANQFLALAEAASGDPGFPVGSLPLLSRADRDAMLRMSRGPWADHDAYRDLGARLREAVRHGAVRPAVTEPGPDGTVRSLSFGQFDQLAGAVARAAATTPPGALIGVHMHRCAELPAVAWGLMAAGRVYLPLDPDMPPERLRAILHEAKPSLVVTHAACQAASEQLAPGRLLRIESLAGDGLSLSDLGLPPQPGGAPAYVIFTSGSTGVPKGAVNTHAALANRIGWMQSAYRLTASDRVICKTPSSFDVSVWELLWGPATGASTVVAPSGAHRDPAALAELIRDCGVSVAHFVPSMLRVFLTEPAAGSITGLRLLICSGESLDRTLQDDAQAVLPAATLVNLYGPAEAAIDVTHWTCRPGDAAVPIGRPIDNASVYVLGGDMQVQPAGVTGDLWIGGLPVGLGYLGQEDLTALQFRPDPFVAGGRLYRTGDRAAYRLGGELDYRGRQDDQVKLGGVRIELGEVEGVLRRHPDVAAAAVALQHGTNGMPRLAAFVVPRAGAVGATVADLLGWMRAHLPAAGSTRIELVERLPMTVSGKLDRRALPALPDALALQPEQAIDAGNPEISQLAAAMAAALGLPRVAPEDDFYDLGGDSLRLLTLVQECRDRGLPASVRDWMAHPTAAAMAAHLARMPRVAPGQGLLNPALVPSDSFPLTSMQRLLVMLSRIDPRYRIYTTTLTLHGALDAALLAEAVAAAVRRHPILRAGVQRPDAGGQVAVLEDVAAPAVDVHDLRSLAADQRAGAFAAWVAAEQRRAFDWQSAPLLRVTVHRMTDEEFRLTLAEPWLDGWSVAMVARQIVADYEALLGHGRVPAPVPDSVARTFAHLEAAAIADGGAVRHWRSRLAGAGDGAVFGRGRELCEPVRLDVPLAPELSRALRSAARTAGLRLKHLLLGVHLRVVGLLAGQRRVVTGVMTHGRPETAGSEAAAGFFLTIVPLTAALDGASWVELGRIARDGELDAQPFCRTPHTVLQEAFGGELPFDTLFNYTDFHAYRPLAAGRHVRLLDFTGSDQTYMPLTAQFTTTLDGDLRLSLDLGLPERHPVEAETIAETYRLALKAAAAAPGQAASGRLLFGAGQASRLEPPPGTLDGRFGEIAAREPGAAALVHAHGVISYAEAEARVRAAAACLLGLGVGPGSRVGLYFPDTSLVPLAALAVLRVGAAFVPLPVGQPPARLRHIVQDADLRIVIVPGQADAQATQGLGAAIKAVCLDGLPPALLDLPPATHDGHAVAHVLYTSGSTGVPKGVVTSHGAVLNRLSWMWRAYPFGHGERLLLKTSLAFVDSVWELFGGLLAGCATVTAAADYRDAGNLVGVVRDFGVTRLTVVPSVMAALVEQPGGMPSLRLCVVSGEACSTRLARQFLERFAPVRLLNLYGSTEVAGDATAYEATGGELGAGLPIGVPIDGVRVEIVDDALELLPPGVRGQILVEGAAVCDGYHKLPDLSASRFDATGGRRRFRTGDAGWLDGAGCLHYAGRLDRQIKIAGVRIEPAEVERAIEAAGARRAHVCSAAAAEPANTAGAEPESGPACLLAFAEWLGTPPDAETLRRSLMERLPRLLIPAEVLPVAALPVNANGKVDVAELLRLLRPSRSPGPRLAEPAPADTVERVVKAAWSELLRVERIEPDHDFFALGGHSLLALRMLNRLREGLDLEIALTAIFDEPVFSDFVDLVREANRLRQHVRVGMGECL